MTRWNMSSLNNLLFYLLTYQMTIHFNVFYALVKYWIFSYMINNLVSQYNLIGHFGAKLSLVNKSLTQTISQVTFTMAQYFLHTRLLHHTLPLTFPWYTFSLQKKKHKRPVVDRLSTGDLVQYYLKNQKLWCVYNPNIEAIFPKTFKYLRICTTASQWVVLVADKINW